MKDGSITCSTCWDWDYGQCERMPGPFVEIHAGTAHNCGISAEGVVTCWGAGGYGVTDPPPVKMRHLGGGYDHASGVTEDDEILCWGDDQ